MTGSPKFLGDPNVPFAHAQATPVSRLNPDRDVRKRRFRFSAWPLQGETQRRSHGKTFEAQSHRFRTRCLRFAVIVTDHHARLASGRWSNPTRRDSRPLGHYQRFLISIHIVIILLRQASWRNPLFLSHAEDIVPQQSSRSCNQIVHGARNQFSFYFLFNNQLS